MLGLLLRLPFAATLAAKVIMCGDSTVSNPSHVGTAHDRLRVGWGAALEQGMLDLEVHNMAHSGASVRTYFNDGYFQAIEDVVEAGDWVICQFGHNELGSYKNSDRPALPGIGYETREIRNLRGQEETVLTFGGYLRKATSKFKDKGAHILILSQTPEVKYSVSEVTPLPPSRFVKFAHDLVQELPGYYYIDHYAGIAQHLREIGCNKAAKLYIDNRHMNKEGAKMAAVVFVKALAKSDCPLKKHIVGSNHTGLTPMIPGNSAAIEKRTLSRKKDVLDKRESSSEENYVLHGDVWVPVNSPTKKSPQPESDILDKRVPSPEENYELHGDVWVPVNTPDGIPQQSEADAVEKRGSSPDESYILHGEIRIPLDTAKRSLQPESDVLEKRDPSSEESYVLHGDVWVPVNAQPESDVVEKRAPSSEESYVLHGDVWVPVDAQPESDVVEKRAPSSEESYVLHGDVWVPVNAQPESDVVEKRWSSSDETYVLHGDHRNSVNSARRSLQPEFDLLEKKEPSLNALPESDAVEKRAPSSEESYVLHGDVWVPVNTPTKRSLDDENLVQADGIEKRSLPGDLELGSGDLNPHTGPGVAASDEERHARHPKHVRRHRNHGHRKRALSQY